MGCVFYHAGERELKIYEPAKPKNISAPEAAMFLIPRDTSEVVPEKVYYGITQ
jgi:hypothetical protein